MGHFSSLSLSHSLSHSPLGGAAEASFSCSFCGWFLLPTVTIDHVTFFTTRNVFCSSWRVLLWEARARGGMLGGSKVHLGPRNAGNKSLLSYRAGHGITGYGGFCPSSESIPIPVKEGPSAIPFSGVSIPRGAPGARAALRVAPCTL